MNSKSPIVSIIIPCYNERDYVKETIQSILNQTFQDFEIIIIDDGSNETIRIFLHALTSNRIRVISQKHKGPSSARNTGFNLAKGNFILAIDSDDTVESIFLEKAVKILNADTASGAVSCYCNVFVKKAKILSKHEPKGGGINNFLFDNNSVSFALIRKEAWLDVGGYDEYMINGFEDWEFWISMTKKGWNIHMIPEFLFNYRKKSKNSVDQNSKLNYREANLNYIYKKHQDIYAPFFCEVVDFLTNLAQRNKRNEIKYKNSLENRIGRIILFPLRKIKYIFN